MYLKLRKIDNILAFKAISERLFLCDKYNILHIGDVRVMDGVDGGTIRIFENILFILSSLENKTYLISANDEVKVINSASWLDTVYEGTIIVYEFLVEERLYSINVYDFINDKIVIENLPKLDLWNLTRLGYLVIYFDRSKTRLACLSLDTGNYEWEVILVEYGEIRKLIGIYANTLWISVNDINDTTLYHLVLIDCENGQILKSFEHDYHFSAYGVMLSEEHKSLVSLQGQLLRSSWFFEYDLETMDIKREVEVISLKEKKLVVRSFTVNGDYIYFTANDSTQVVANCVGVLNYYTLELLWYDKVSPGNLKLDPPQIAGDKLYVLGAEGTLHVYKKENTI